ncbi:preprotein translocase subunit SecY [Candidatus Endowatersipora endosymbiont of Watersipora subatra]|uniref:preprotein translocase subunit SecY n=1 Tax=Candidatus Endowatersipora endosymbiont of Watersipora subatra TaxID=3077946 RepID=UPI00312CAFAE
MASAAEQLAANMSFSTFSKAKDLKRRLWFTLFALIVYRIGTYIPIPGINTEHFAAAFQKQSEGVLGLFNMFSGGAVERLAIFALGIMPYISASIIMQLVTSIHPHLEQLKKDGEHGRKIINQYTRYSTVILGSLQAYGIAASLQSSDGLVLNPGLFFILTTVLTLVGGTIFLMWLGDQITARGIGNGISLIIFSGIVAALPTAVAQLMDAGSTGAISTLTQLGVLLSIVILISLIIVIERAQRRLLVQYPKRQVGNKMFQGDTSHLPLKINTSGVIPAIFASSLLLLPTTITGFSGLEGHSGWINIVNTFLGRGQWGYLIFYGSMIVFFSFFYTALVFNPTETADNLKKHGGFIIGIRPGERTAKYIDYVLTRITVLGSLYLVFVCLLPEIFLTGLGISVFLGGTSLLIVVNVTMDTVSQIQSHLFAQQYEGLIKKSSLRSPKRSRKKGAKRKK